MTSQQFERIILTGRLRDLCHHSYFLWRQKSDLYAFVAFVFAFLSLFDKVEGT